MSPASLHARETGAAPKGGGVLVAAQPLRCLLFQPGGHGKSAVRAGYRDALHRLLGIEGVVGRFLGDIDVVGVGLLESGGGDLHELGLGV